MLAYLLYRRGEHGHGQHGHAHHQHAVSAKVEIGMLVLGVHLVVASRGRLGCDQYRRETIGWLPAAGVQPGPASVS